MGRTIRDRQNNINVPVIIQVPESCASAGPSLLKHLPRKRADVHKLSPNVSQQEWSLAISDRRLRQFDVVHHVTVREKHLIPSIIIEIQNVHPPSPEMIRDCI